MNKIVIITGGTSGIGLDLKNLFTKNGDIVITLSTRDLDEENHYSCDVSDENKVKETISLIAEKYGHIDIVINNAGFGMSGITELVPTEKIHHLTEVNYFGTLYVTRACLPYMKSGSKIINVSSAMALFPVPFRAIYGSIKSAVLTLSFALRMELAPLGIDVVAFCPGDIKTNFTKNRIKEFEINERYGNRLKTATEKSDSREEKRIPSFVCAKQMFKKITKKHTRPFYIIGFKYKLLYALCKITPKSWLLKITNKLYGGTK